MREAKSGGSNLLLGLSTQCYCGRARSGDESGQHVFVRVYSSVVCTSLHRSRCCSRCHWECFSCHSDLFRVMLFFKFEFQEIEQIQRSSLYSLNHSLNMLS